MSSKILNPEDVKRKTLENIQFELDWLQSKKKSILHSISKKINRIVNEGLKQEVEIYHSDIRQVRYGFEHLRVNVVLEEIAKWLEELGYKCQVSGWYHEKITVSWSHVFKKEN